MWVLILTLLAPIYTTILIPCYSYDDCHIKSERILTGFEYAALTDPTYRPEFYQIKVVWQPSQP